MAKIIDIRPRQEPRSYILYEGKKVPFYDDFEKLRKSPLLKKHRSLIKEFPNGEFNQRLEDLSSLSILNTYSDKIKVARIRKIIKEIQEINLNINTYVNEIYKVYSKGDLHIEQTYIDYYTKIKDTTRIEKRIAGLQQTINEMNDLLGKELETDKLIEEGCDKQYHHALELKKEFYEISNLNSILTRINIFIGRKKIDIIERIILNTTEVIIQISKEMRDKSKKLTKNMRTMIDLYNQTAKKQLKELRKLTV